MRRNIGPEVMILSVSGVVDCSEGVVCGSLLSSADCSFLLVGLACTSNTFNENNCCLERNSRYALSNNDSIFARQVLR